jgi:hypothetical protein
VDDLRRFVFSPIGFNYQRPQFKLRPFFGLFAFALIDARFIATILEAAPNRPRRHDRGGSRSSEVSCDSQRGCRAFQPGQTSRYPREKPTIHSPRKFMRAPKTQSLMLAPQNFFLKKTTH